jgi:hypothetical protein
MRGGITISELEEIESSHTRDLKEAVLTLARGKLENNVQFAKKTKGPSAIR